MLLGLLKRDSYRMIPVYFIGGECRGTLVFLHSGIRVSTFMSAIMPLQKSPHLVPDTGKCCASRWLRVSAFPDALGDALQDGTVQQDAPEHAYGQRLFLITE